ncbi:unnamed protein product [Pocillopora meandrina]|uniref:C-type lectin domain-containing protein n=1 Tax=Pocillopora meandrina TaxID=46732 RepID=A0AAU9Y2T3_9CNID|nr:unnamed protein product [Pocillopora meandrina]
MKLPGTECQPTCFKNSSYIFSKGKIYRFPNNEVCSILGGYLVSIETEEEWQFINHEIQKRGTWNTSTTNAWLIGLEKKDGVWIWKSGEQLNISKWRDSEPNVNDERAEISMNGGLFNGISRNDKGDAYICEMPGECPNITFKNSWYIISVDGESWYWGRHTCSSLGGDLVSFETQEEWSLINDEIQRRNTTNYENKWRIGLKKGPGIGPG